MEDCEENYAESVKCKHIPFNLSKPSFNFIPVSIGALLREVSGAWILE